MEDYKIKILFTVHYDRSKNIKEELESFTPETQAKRKTTIREEKKIFLGSSDDVDIIRTESSSENETNLNSYDQLEGENAFKPLNATNGSSEK